MAFCVSHDLNAFAGEVAFESSEGEAGAVDGGFANDAFETLCAGDEFEAERTGVLSVKSFDRDNVALQCHGWDGTALGCKCQSNCGLRIDFELGEFGIVFEPRAGTFERAVLIEATAA